ncbi:MAG TPA: MopE-related protein [Polyangia bacterium]|nr:MopE-related protein [Polyangia bacterium]
MARSRGGGRLVGLLSLGVLGALGCGGSKNQGPSDAAVDAALRFLSTPVQHAEVGGTLQYQAALSSPGEVQWILEKGPHGATVNQGGQVTWSPDATQSGTQAFQVLAMVDGHMVEQSFDVTAASALSQASAHADPANPNGTSVSVDAPLSEVQGAALQLAPGALPPGDPVAVSISSMAHPPLPPDMMMVPNIDPHDVHPVELHPSGLTFTQPVRLQLPIGPSLRALTNLTIKTYDYSVGQWKKVKVVDVDQAAHVITAEVQHFSPYVVTPDVKVIDLQASLGGAACAQAVVVRAPLVPKLSDVPAAVVNGWSGAGSTVADVLGALAPGQALQIFTRVGARSLAGTGAQSGWSLAAATKQKDGTLVVSAATDSHANGFLAVPTAGLGASDPELLAWMNGTRADFVFSSLDGGAGVAVTGEVSLYIAAGADATRPPPASANAFATDEVDFETLAATTGDDDCDGALDAWDADPRGAAPPVLVASPGSPAHVVVGAASTFEVSSPQPGVTFAWTVSDPSVTLAPDAAGGSAKATPSVPGLFTLTVTGTVGGASSRASWDVIADPAAVASQNGAPVVTLAASSSLVRVGEKATLTAIGKDPEQSALTYAWTGDASALSALSGDAVIFAPTAPGDYKVSVVASDGAAKSSPASVTITVLSATANRPPGVPSVKPLATVLTHAAGQAVSLTLAASAVDPDGDAVTYDFAPDALTPPTFTLTKTGAAAAFATASDGVYVFYVTATDAKGAVSPWASVKIVVLPPISTTPVDADGDGYPPPFDCDDSKADVHPGAKEICGDDVDQDCDGHDLATAQCDADGDRFSPAQGDCDDTNAAIGPQVVERCDGIDNNCDKQIDEGFGVGATCTSGVGACAVSAKTVCSASYASVVCGGTPGQPGVETCNGKDDDCDGLVDDVAGTAAGDVASCGGCNVACAAPANATPACVKGGCTTSCKAGYVDADRDPANGCECALTNGGVEICDGVDNDCNGVADDGITTSFYAADPTTLGKGVCAAGTQRCLAGELVVTKPAALPGPEVCNGVDDNCNGTVDEGCVGGPDGGVPPGDGGSNDGSLPTIDGGVPPGDGGVGGNLAICLNSAGGPECVDLLVDGTNCGKCGNMCGATQVCSSGTCVTVANDCKAGYAQCKDPQSGALICVDTTTDAKNCGACNLACASGVCASGHCTTQTSSDGGATTFAATSTAQTTATSTGGCGGSFTMCGTGCTSLQDDPRNCNGCGMFCDGTCSGGACTFSAGDLPFGATCTKNTDCGTGFCMDQTRFGWPGGFCSTLCDVGIPCQTGQACVSSPLSGTFGSCLAQCATDADCAAVRDGFVCDAGTCAPDCRQAAVCASGQTCDSGGHCVTPACPSGTLSCDVGADKGSVCTDPMRDPVNCGGCGKVCAQNAICTNGQCQGGGGTYIGLAACPNAGAALCANLLTDPRNCGACGNVCPTSQPCNAGACGIPPTFDASAPSDDAAVTYPPPTCTGGMITCTPAAGPAYCSDIMIDTNNCGKCFNVCSAGYYCSDATCLPQQVQQDASMAIKCAYPQVACDGTYCADFTTDKQNCGGCHLACQATELCSNSVCTPG